MMQVQLLRSLFKPHKIHKKKFTDFLDEKTKRNFFKHKLWFECSKSKNESCINHKCRYNFVEMHNQELYDDLMQEIQDEWIN